MVKLVALAFLITLITLLLIVPMLRIIVNFKKIKNIPLKPSSLKGSSNDQIKSTVDPSFNYRSAEAQHAYDLTVNPMYSMFPQNVWHNRK